MDPSQELPIMTWQFYFW